MTPDDAARVRAWCRPDNEDHGMLRDKPPALEVGQVWVGDDEMPRRIRAVTSEGILFQSYWCQSTVNAVATWTEWREWQQRHAARVQTEDERRKQDMAGALLGVGKALQRQAEDDAAQPQQGGRDE